MKTYPFITPGLLMFVCAATFSAISVNAQTPVPDAPTVADAPTVPSAPGLGADELEELVGPIALYPDALIALILPAATVSSDVVLAARFIKGGGSVAQIDSQPWEDSVKGLTHYPDVVKWMDENLSWTQRVGEAYLAQPQAVMDAIQRARAIARSNGVLVDTPQQRVVVEDNYIRIIPAQRDVIYVPRYDPEIIYVQRPLYYHPDPWLTFGIGFGVGSWLSHDLDWRSRVIWVDPHCRENWRRYHHHDWRHRRHDHHAHWRHWKPSPGRHHHHHHPRRDIHRWGKDHGRPAPLPGAPRFDRERWKRNDRNEHFSGGGRPGVVRPDHRRNRESETHAARPHSGGFRRHGHGTEPQVNPNPRPASTPPPQVAPQQATSRDERRRQWEARNPNRDGRPGVDRSLPGRRSENTVSTPASPPAQRQWQAPRGTNEAPRGTNEAGVEGTSERRVRPAPGTRDHVRQVRPATPSPSVRQHSPAVVQQQRPAQQRPAAVAVAPAPQVRSAPPQQRQFNQPARIAPAASAPAVAPRAAPAARSQANEVRAASGDSAPRAAANHGGGRGEGRGSRQRGVER